MVAQAGRHQDRYRGVGGVIHAKEGPSRHLTATRIDERGLTYMVIWVRGFGTNIAPYNIGLLDSCLPPGPPMQ